MRLLIKEIIVDDDMATIKHIVPSADFSQLLPQDNIKLHIQNLYTKQKKGTEMATIQRNVLINASPEKTMTILMEANRWTEWYPGMTEIHIDAKFPEKGGKVTFGVKSAGLSFQITETVLEYQPNKLQVLQMEGMMIGKARWEANLEGNGTRLTTTFDYKMGGGVLGKIADSLIVKHLNAKSLNDGLNNFKELVECM